MEEFVWATAFCNLPNLFKQPKMQPQAMVIYKLINIYN